jgi:hypothetical protein
LIPVEFLLDFVSEWLPIAVQDVRPKEILHLKVALALEDPVSVHTEAFERKCNS